MKPSFGGSPEAVLHDADRVLYVEGKVGSLDPDVLQELVPLGWRVKGLGPSQEIRAVARALHQSHPRYCFVIDRDHHSEAEVEQTWADFPDPGKRNLLMWRRRELENYFITPSWLAQSAFLRQGWTQERLTQRLVELVEQRIYMDCANLVIAQVRESQKANWISAFDSPSALNSATAARAALLARPEWQQRADNVTAAISTTELSHRYDAQLADALGGADRVTMGHGKWESLVAGKPVFHGLANEAFLVKRTDGQPVQGAEARRQLARDMLNKSILHADLAAVPELLRRLSTP